MSSAARRIARGPSLTSTWGLLAWLTVPLTAVATIGPVHEADVYWHIRMGGDILSEGRFTGDPAWTFGPADATWRTTQAGAEVLLYLLHLVGSWPAVMLFRVGLAAVVMTSLLVATTRVVQTRPRLPIDRSVALVAIVLSVTMVEFVQERPQTLSLVLFPWIGVLLLRVTYTDRWPRWWVVGLFVMVWSWFHGAAIVIGPLLVAAALIHALGVGGLRWLPVLVRSVRRGWAVVLAAVVAPLAGPIGLGYYAQARQIQDAASSRIIEWTPAAANSAYVWSALVLVLLWGMSVARLAARSGSLWRTFRMDLLWIVALLIFMTSTSRSIGIGVLLLAPMVARRLAQAWSRPQVAIERIRRPVAIVVLGVVAVASVLLAGLAAAHVRAVDTGNPPRIWAGLAAEAGERRAFVAYELGGQAGLLGEVVVSIDGRADRYGGQGIDHVVDIIDGRPGWEGMLAEYPGTTDVVIPTDSAIVAPLEAAGWTKACTDGDYVWLTAPGVGGQCPDPAAD